MAALRNYFFVFLCLASYSSSKELRGIPPTIVNGLRCYWKYTCFIPTRYSIDAGCNLYVPQRFCESVKIQLQPNTNQIQTTTVEAATVDTTTTMAAPETDTSSANTSTIQKPNLNTFSVIEASVNCPQNQLPDHNGNCKLVFSRNSK
ncbi:uncharacterized protein LOC143921751 [Arctopsyche grandis]|uniref:uncharacterized protein LOC143921751 n=1 Tax=Arctopsyche grandis TaxID=121162 RepID=UPI00406D78BC